MQLLESVYPSLLDPSRPQKVEVFVPLSHTLDVAEPLPQTEGSDDLEANDLEESAESPFATDSKSASPSHKHGLNENGPSSERNGILPLLEPGENGTEPPSELGEEKSMPPSEVSDPPMLGQNANHLFMEGSGTPPSLLGQSLVSSPSSGTGFLHRRVSDGISVTPLVTTPSPSLATRAAKLSDHSWEVVSKYSTTSNRLSILQDQSDPDYNLIPLWECLQVYYHRHHPPHHGARG